MSTANDLFALLAARTRAWQFYNWYWGDAIAIDGLLEARRDDEPGIRTWVVEQLTRWATTAPDNYDDVLAPGRAIVNLVSSKDLDRRALDRFINAVDRLPVLDCGMPALEPHRPVYRFGACIDALYHLPVALAAHGRYVGDEKRIHRAIHMAVATSDALACEGGWAQWYDAAQRRNNGIPWSRGVGWAVLGLLDLLEIVDGLPGSERVREIAVAMLELLAKTQRDDGNWPGVLGDDEAMVETSTAAFFIASARHPTIKATWKAPSDVLERAVASLKRAVDSEGVARGVSCDILPSWDIEGYRRFRCEPSPWGQGAALRAASALRDDEGDCP